MPLTQIVGPVARRLQTKRHLRPYLHRSSFHYAWRRLMIVLSLLAGSARHRSIGGKTTKSHAPLAQHDIYSHIGCRKGFLAMKNIQSLLVVLVGIIAFAGLALLTVSLTLVFAAILTVLLAVRVLSARAKPVPVRADAKGRQPMRIWNDGRGTIIDL